jgi:hypothetical protein
MDSRTGESILKVAKQVYFPYRTYEDILDKCKLKYPEIKSQIESFRIYILNNKKSLKEKDAVRLLKHIKNIHEPQKQWS